MHLGVGGFHRSHQAVYLDQLADLDPALGWSVTGMGLRSCGNREDLLAQDCLYTVLERGDHGESARVVGVMRDYLSAASDRAAAMGVLSDPRTQLVTVTVTAPTYGSDPAPDDVFNLLAGAFEARRRRGAGPVTVLSCDNLRRNGDTTRTRVLAAAADRSDALASWIEYRVAFPNSMVDRITPPPAPRDSRYLRRRYGLHDRVPVVTEAFRQWVVEDSWAADRPRLEEVGMTLTTDVGPFVDLKTRVLNGAHLALGFLSTATGHTTAQEAMADHDLRSAVERMLSREVRPGLPAVPGVDVADYVRLTLARVAQPGVADPLSRLRRRGSVRMREYLLPSLEAALADRRDHEVMLRVLVEWIRHLERAAAEVTEGRATAAEVADRLAEPLARELLPLASRAHRDVRPFLAAVPGLDRLTTHVEFTAALQQRLTVQEVRTRATAS
ncbi:MAG TPA: mannitol dehydrogenase family protein [Nocardioides sp.]|nr:mannitol dehydrogenase family protein [Nocardioides sp.]